MKKYLGYMIIITIMAIVCIYYENTVNKLNKQLEEKEGQIIVLEGIIDSLQKDIEYNEWYIRFYEDFHKEVGAFE